MGELDKLIGKTLNDDIDWEQCGVNVNGENTPECKEHRCANTVMDDSGRQYCMIQRKGPLENERNEIMWLSPMLDYFWRHGIGSKGIEFFKATGFITPYRDLKEDRFNDAANPYGKTVNAFMIVEGWRIRYLLCLIAISLVVSIGVVCGVAVVSHSVAMD
ncbi:hypothetical protein GJ744_009058 [Endocarpon pusillum]|uniref:Uncharacterized protein n=1 Tax=Endocarpon pusillum TaxID=364733 RepID=A0A8H7AKA7_9EURO|nr:hypothetical protein GJ744_009058 [Endocarpon pusillum]